MKLVNCPFHAILIDKAKEQMAEIGLFRKEDVLEAAGFSPYGSLAAWWFVCREVAHELGEELVPITDGDRRFDPNIHPEKSLPSAYRRTTGYARASTLPVPVVEMWAQRRFNQAAGQWKSVERFAVSCQKQGIAIGFTHQLTLPTLQLGAGAAE